MSTPTKLIIPFVLVAAVSCTVHETTAPPFAGPSEFALRLALQAIPDSILQDGFSQTAINIDASGVEGRPVRGLAMRVEIIFGGIVQDFGVLSAKTVVTGDDGRARVIYTSPPRPATPVETGNVVTIFVTPIGNDFRGEISRTVDIRLVTPGVIQPPPPPNDAPVAVFNAVPASPPAFSLVTFDASQSTDEGVPCGAACTYAWDFGDGSTGTGVFTSHTYRTVGNYQVVLTVTDSSGLTGRAAQTLAVGASAAPTAAFTFAPAAPAAGQTIFFSATASTAVPPRRIVSYDWNFGTDRTASGVTVSKGYELPGTYPVTLTVTDDAGAQNTVTHDVTVTRIGPELDAILEYSPHDPTTSTNIFFDGSASVRGPSPIIEYRFTFGDTTPDVVGPAPTTTHRYSLPGSYIARLTIRDSAGRTDTTTQNVVVR